MSHPHDRYRYCKPIKGKSGAIGQLFKFSLATHGYTLVAKGTFAAAMPCIPHEETIYLQLHALQGHTIPVHLGSIALERPYPLLMATIVYMLLMSWGGEAVEDLDDALRQYGPLRKLLYSYGVVHDDVRRMSLLWNRKRGGIMVIDFDVARVVPRVRHKQVGRLAEKRKRKRVDVEWS